MSGPGDVVSLSMFSKSNDHTGRHCFIRPFVHKDEASGNPVLAVAVKEQGLGRMDAHAGDVVHLQLADIFDPRKRVNVQLVLDLLQYTEDTLGDRKSTRLNSSHVKISYAVFCLKKKKQSHQSHDIH